MKLRFALLALLFSCTYSPNEIDDSHSSFTKARSLGVIDKRLPEASRLASSVVNPGYMWSQNDGQNPAEVYLIDTTAQVKMTCKLSVENRDWEDIAVGPGPEEGKTYV